MLQSMQFWVQSCGRRVNHLMNLWLPFLGVKQGHCLDKCMSDLEHHLRSLPMGLVQLCCFILQQGQSCLVLLGGKGFLTFWKEHAKGGDGGKLHYSDQTVAQEKSAVLYKWVKVILFEYPETQASQWLSSKEPACQCRIHKRRRFDPSVRKIPWRIKRQTTPVFLPWESHGQRSYSSWDRKESDTT